MSVASRTLIATDATRLSIASIVLILGILLWVYRSVPVVLLCFLPAVTGLVAGIVAVSAWFGTVHGITLGFGATLLGEAVDYPSFLLTQLRAGESVSEARTRARRRRCAWPILTTACGSVALLFADFPGLAQLGMLTMVGILVAGAMTYWVLPLWIPAAMVRVPEQVKAPMQVPGANWRWRVAIALVFVVAGALLESAVVRRRCRQPESAAGSAQGPGPRIARCARCARCSVFAGRQWRRRGRTFCVARRKCGPACKRWLPAARFGGFDLVSDLLPSESTQAIRQAALPAGPRLRANLDEAQTGLPFRPHTFDPFLADVEAAQERAAIVAIVDGGYRAGIQGRIIAATRCRRRWHAGRGLVCGHSAARRHRPRGRRSRRRRHGQRAGSLDRPARGIIGNDDDIPAAGHAVFGTRRASDIWRSCAWIAQRLRGRSA